VSGTVSTVAILTAASASIGSALRVTDGPPIGGATCTVGGVNGLSLHSWHSTSVRGVIGLVIVGVCFTSGVC
jgi:hypothetical protein